MESDPDAPPAKVRRLKPKVSKEWFEEDVFKLISMVETKPCLWNAADEGYHNKVLRENAWQSIEEFFGAKYAVSDLHAKWTNMRIQFRGYAARAKTKSGQGAEEAPKWRFYNAMAFVGRAEDQQTSATISNLSFDVYSDSSSVDLSFSSTPSTREAATTTKNRSHVPEGQSAAAQIAETMRDALVSLKERQQNVSNANVSLANYILSEFNILSDSSAAAVRKKVASQFLECIEQEQEAQY